MSTIELHDVSLTYADGTAAVRGVDLSISAGEFAVLLGPSGCGKTSTLRMVAGLEMPTSGRILLGGADATRLPPAQRDIGFVFQFYALYPTMTVADNIAFPLANAGLARAEQDRRVAVIATRLGLTELMPRRPRQLSGGDQQRVALARSLVRTPMLWLMDEPLGTLDGDQRQALAERIREQQQEHRVTTLYVTHDQDEAMRLADRIVVMRSGRILQIGSPAAVYDRPATAEVAHFLGSPGMNLLRGTSDGEGRNLLAGGAVLPLPAPLPAGQDVVAGIRPEFLHPAADGPLLAELHHDEYQGSCRIWHTLTAFGPVAVRAPAGPAQAAGSRLRLAADPDRWRFFHPASGESLP